MRTTLHTIDICPQGEIGIVGEGLGDIGIRAINITVFLDIVSDHARIIQPTKAHTRQSAMKPIQYFLRDRVHTSETRIVLIVRGRETYGGEHFWPAFGNSRVRVEVVHLSHPWRHP